MAWKSSVELPRQEVITRLYNVIWEELPDADLEDALNAAMGEDYGTTYYIQPSVMKTDASTNHEK